MADESKCLKPLLDNTSQKNIFRSIIYILLVLASFLISIDLLVNSLGHLGRDVVQSILEVTANPFVSLFIGLMITALIQSSSTTTSMIVAMVASGSIDMQRAIPIVMGANIGTTLTSNIISLSFITKKNKFRRAFSTATVHDHFNILVTVILFPLQYQYNFLSGISERIYGLFTLNHNSYSNVDYATAQVSSFLLSDKILEFIGYPVVGLIIAVVVLFASIKLLTRLIYRTVIGSAKLKFDNLVFSNAWKSFGWGTALTAAIQSSSVTTSLTVPLVATGKIKLKQVYPFIIGANIGTTITALLAALFKSPEAISIAVAHLSFNVIGGVIFLLIPFINRLPVRMAEILGELCMNYKIISIIYIIITFFLLPFAFIYLTE